MELFQPFQDMFLWLVRSSFYGTVLLVMILLVRAVTRRQFRFRMVYWLWMVLLVRLIWPLDVQTTFSVFNLMPRQVTPEQFFTPQAAEEQPANNKALTEKESAAPSISTPSVVSEVPPIESDLPQASVTAPLDWQMMLCAVWLAGGGLLSVWVLGNNFKLWRIVKRRRLVTRQDILELLEDCKGQLGLQTVIGVVETDEVKTPCLFGYLRPRLLLPVGILDEMDTSQLRYVFLHELAHLKRHDILIGWLMAVVQVLHWFNPAVWYAMSRINADRELACDELALSTLKEQESNQYGATILTFLERFARGQKLPAMAGIAENKSLLRRRMTMIARFKNQKDSFIPVLAVMLVLAATTFTTARTAAHVDTAVTTVQTILETSLAANDQPVMLAQDDGKSAGQNSIAGSGHVVRFKIAQATELIGVKIYGSRYGTPQPPQENFFVWLADMNQEVFATFEYPYSKFKRGEPKWYSFKTDATKLPEEFYLCVGFNPEKTKGVYVHHDAEAGGASYLGLPHDNVEFKAYDRGDWMIRAVVRPTGETLAVAETVSEPADENSLQAMIDATEAGKTLTIPAGTYEEPIKISQAIRLVGSEDGQTVIKVTANEPAILIDTKGKGQVEVRNLTINWQLATSDKHDMPFAVAVKDTEAVITDCVFKPLGNPQRSPVAIRSMGFSKMNVGSCDFSGFDYVVCYGEGTKGSMSRCFIRDCGHQGVILYSGAEATVERNIITGSKFHAVRSTGGKLTMKDNLIINNSNRGVYLGNKSCSGSITNNLLIGNASGIDGMSACKFKVANNVILKSTYAAIAVRPYSMLDIQNNVISDGPRGVIVHQEEGKSDPVRSQIGKNLLWKNQTDFENCDSPDTIKQEPDFIEPGNGNFKLADTAFEGIGLSDPKVIFDLWQKYKESQ